MFEYRTFLNSDIASLLEIWKNQHPDSCWHQPLSVSLLEQAVLSKTYFRNYELFLAFTQEKQPVGFCHLFSQMVEADPAFGTTQGMICNLMVVPPYTEEATSGLLEKAGDYLAQKGVTTIQLGESKECSPYYGGLGGANQAVGFRQAHRTFVSAVEKSGYLPKKEYVIMDLDIEQFRPPFSRQLVQLRRQFQMVLAELTPAKNWWHATSQKNHHHWTFQLIDQRQQVHGQAKVCCFDPLGDGGFTRTVMLEDISITETSRKQGLGRLLLFEFIRFLQEQRLYFELELILEKSNTLAHEFFLALGFQKRDERVLFGKKLSSS